MKYTKEIKYKKALKEVYELIKVLPEYEKNKIPEKYILNLEREMDDSHNFIYDMEKTLSQQNFMNESKAIIVDIYIKYFSTEEEKEKWEKYYRISNKLLEEEKRRRFNPDNIFIRNNDQKEIEKIKEKEETSLIVIRENFLNKILNKMKDLINKFFTRG